MGYPKVENAQMGAIMKQSDLANILLQNWDPIGISNEPLAQDEYQPYVPILFSLLTTDASIDMVAPKLLEIEQTEMGFAGDVERAHRVAVLLKSLI